MHIAKCLNIEVWPYTDTCICKGAKTGVFVYSDIWICEYCSIKICRLEWGKTIIDTGKDRTGGENGYKWK